MEPLVEVQTKGQAARRAALVLASLTTSDKNKALELIADLLEERTGYILTENTKDMRAGKENGMTEALLDRLLLSEGRLKSLADSVREVVGLADPVGEVVDGLRRPNGLRITRVRAPMGVVGIIYEARPNVTADAAALCLKSGNAVILRGGKEAIRSNTALVRVIQEGLEKAGLPKDCVQLIENTDRESARELMRAKAYLDVLIPRGGAGLIQTVTENATVPTIETGVGNCHIYIDSPSKLEMAKALVVNSKCHRPGVCNAAETLLVHQDVAAEYLPVLVQALVDSKVELRGCERTRQLCPELPIKPATEDDWREEYLALVMAVKVVTSLEEAIAHINTYGTRHTEAIVTDDYFHATQFCQQVDAAAVNVNASTRFTDGGQYGLGAEIGISTQKLHARGPMGLRELTTIKWIVQGEGQIRS